MERRPTGSIESNIRFLTANELNDSLRHSDKMKLAAAAVFAFGLWSAVYGTWVIAEYGEKSNVNEQTAGVIFAGVVIQLCSAYFGLMHRAQGRMLANEARRRGLFVDDGFIRSVRENQLESPKLREPDKSRYIRFK